MFNIIFERVPLVWVLVGLLFNTAGLYLGFEYQLTFVYLILGWFCMAYGLALFAFRFREKPKTTAATRLSPNFVSAGATVMMPAMSASQNSDSSETPA